MIIEPSTSSGLITVSTTVIAAAPGLLHSLILNPGSAASTVTIYDNATTNSGTVLAQLIGVANGSSISIPMHSPIFATKGLTMVVAGTAATATCSYSRSS